MRRKSIAFLMAIVMMVTLIGAQLTAFAADSGIAVQFHNGGNSSSSNTIYAKFKVTNNTGSALDLTTLKLRYYYTIDADKAQNFWCDHAGYMSGYNYITATSYVTGTFVKMSEATSTADYYLEVGFASGAGSLPAGSTIEVQTRVARSDWSNYDQSNDYSYKSISSYTDWTNVTAYVNGTLVYGTPVVQGPSISPTTATFNKATPANISVALTPQGKTFAGITGLTAGTDYTVSGNTVTILKSYLSTLTAGTKTLTFDFGVTTNPTLTVTVVDPTPSISPSSTKFVEGAASDVSVTLTGNGYTFSGITGLTAGTDYTVSGTKVTLLKSFLNSLATGTYTYTFDFGAGTKNPTFTVTVNKNTNVTVTIGTASGSTGDTVTVPVTLKGVANAGSIATFGATIKYDSTLLQAVSVTAGEIIPVSSYLSAEIGTGTVNLLFLDETFADSLITTDGVAAYITFKILGTTDTTTALTFTGDTTFGDVNMSTLTTTLAAGSVTITAVPTPTITPTTATFDLYTPADISVALTSNGYTFNGITGLTAGTNYTVSGSTVTLSKSYLSTLAVGTYTLTFNFGAASNPVLTVKVIDSTPAKVLGVTIGTASGTAGDTVTVPVTLSNVSAIETFGFDVTYDSAQLEAVSVTAGDIVTNGSTNLSTEIGTGKISFLYLDMTVGDEPITSDGVVAYITFKITGTADAVVPVAFSGDKTFADLTLTNISNITYADGSVTIKAGTVVVGTPSITPTTSTFTAGSASNIAVTLTANGNTFAGITGLTAGTDYTVSGSTVTLLSSYLNKLTAGTTALTFDFGSSSNPVLTLTVAAAPVEDTTFTVTLGSVSGKTGDTITVPVTISNISSIGSLVTFGFNVKYDSTVLTATKVTAGSMVTNGSTYLSGSINSGKIAFLYLDYTMGEEPINTDGVVAYITFTVTGTTSTVSTVSFDTTSATFADVNLNDITDYKLVNGTVTLN